MPSSVDIVCRHLAIVAVDGAGTETERTLAPEFVLHLDGAVLDRSGYLALIAARWATEGERPPLEVIANTAAPNTTDDAGLVTVALAPRGLGHFHVADGVITAAWITTDWNTWLVPLQVGQTF